jgi:flavin reductase (DIM6/NTAB) family NADH-FMN oxidoreductase RutF
MTVDAATFRHVLSAVPTAVSVLTIVDSHGVDRGMTVGAFCSLSLSPPLVLACVGDDATIADAMRSAKAFALSVLAEDQADLSRLFADTDARGFGGVDNSRGPGGMLLIEGAAARLECRITARYPGGDHTIVIGEVTYADVSPRRPLMHHRSSYGRLAP